MGKELVDATHHELLQQHQVGERGDVLEPLSHELGEPAQGLREPEEPVGDIEGVLRLLPGRRDVVRPRSARQRAGDQLGLGDVDDALAARLGAGDADETADLTGSALAGRSGQLVRVVTRRSEESAGRPHFWVALHVLAWFVQAGLYHHLPSFSGFTALLHYPIMLLRIGP